MKGLKIYINNAYRIFKEKLYVLLYSSKNITKIYAYSPESTTIANEIKSKINQASPHLKVNFIGSASLEIAGCKDVDIFVECKPSDFNKFVVFFNDNFGKFVNAKKDFIEWQTKKNDYEIDILLIDPDSEKFKYQVGMVYFLKKNKFFLEKYEKLKWKMDGMSERRYQYEKNKFFNEIIKHNNIKELSLEGFDGFGIREERNRAEMLSVTIGIPAYNEEMNIGHILECLKDQMNEGFFIEEIVVISDGSQDKTEDVVLNHGSKFKKIRLIADGNRRGKSTRLNQLFREVESDIAIILDADIKLSDKNVIKNLVRPLIENVEIMHVSGHALPVKPTEIIEKIAYAGILIWEYVRMNPKSSELYLSEGSIRAFRREVYKKMIFPNSSADEAFSFLFCEKHEYKFGWAKEALVFYQLPRNISDYIKQVKRFLKSGNIQEDIFGKEFLNKYYNITRFDKVISLFIHLRKNFLWTFFYVLIIPLPRLFLLFDKVEADGIWDVITSTKNIEAGEVLNRKKIVFSNYDDLKNPWYGGGGALAIHEVAKRLSEHFSITVITGRYPNSKNEFIDGVNYRRIGSSLLGPKIGQLIYSFALLFYVKKEKFDLWFESFTPPFTTGLLPIFTKKPVIGVTHMLSGMDMYRKYKIPFYLFERFGFKFYNRFIVLSQVLKNEIKKYNNSAQIEVISNGVNSQTQRNIEDDKNLAIFIGRIEINQKGLDLLVDAFAGIRQLDGFKLLIAGSGNEKEERNLNERITEMSLADKARFIGRVDGEEKNKFFKEASFLIMPSRFDTFSLVVLEAFSYGLPVIVFDLENLKWIPNECAIKVRPFDVVELAKAIEKLIANPELRREMGNRAWEFSKDFSWDSIGKKYLNYINDIL